MTRIVPRMGWKEGRFLVMAVSQDALIEWLAFAHRCPEAAQRAFERLSNNPLGHQPRVQFPLRGKLFSALWELEISSKERIWYAVDEVGMITIIAARNDVLSPPAQSALLGARQVAYEAAALRIAILGEVEAELRVPAWAIQGK